MGHKEPSPPPCYSLSSLSLLKENKGFVTPERVYLSLATSHVYYLQVINSLVVRSRTFPRCPKNSHTQFATNILLIGRSPTTIHWYIVTIAGSILLLFWCNSEYSVRVSHVKAIKLSLHHCLFRQNSV